MAQEPLGQTSQKANLGIYTLKGGKSKSFYFHISGWGPRAIYHSDIFEKLRPPPCTVTVGQYQGAH